MCGWIKTHLENCRLQHGGRDMAPRRCFCSRSQGSGPGPGGSAHRSVAKLIRLQTQASCLHTGGMLSRVRGPPADQAAPTSSFSRLKSRLGQAGAFWAGKMWFLINAVIHVCSLISWQVLWWLEGVHTLHGGFQGLCPPVPPKFRFLPCSQHQAVS